MVTRLGAKRSAGPSLRAQRNFLAATGFVGARRRIRPERRVRLGTSHASPRPHVAGVFRSSSATSSDVSSGFRDAQDLHRSGTRSAEQPGEFVVYLSRRTRLHLECRTKRGPMVAKNRPIRRTFVSGWGQTYRVPGTRRSRGDVGRGCFCEYSFGYSRTNRRKPDDRGESNVSSESGRAGVFRAAVRRRDQGIGSIT